MLFLAATAVDKLSKVPPMFWVKVVGAIAGFVIAILVLRKLLEVNKVLVIAISVISFSVLWFQWIYERNEPSFMTPIIEPMSQFFPSKGSYDAKQAQDPGKPGSKKSAKPTTPPKS
jgi:hypothetical protein